MNWCDITGIGGNIVNYEEAKEYYCDELCNLLIKIYNFCKQSGYVIYQHATDLESANNIIKKDLSVQQLKLTVSQMKY